MIAGLSGYQRNGAVAVGTRDRLAAVCEQGRVVRIRDVGLKTSGFPATALSAALRAAHASEDVTEFIAAEDGLQSIRPDARRIDHHFAHAATAFLTSPFPDAVVLVCDTHQGDGLSVWQGTGGSLTRVPIGWHGEGFAALYSKLTALLGYTAGSDEYKVEALARFGLGAGVKVVEDVLHYSNANLQVLPRFETYISEAASSQGMGDRAQVAGALQTADWRAAGRVSPRRQARYRLDRAVRWRRPLLQHLSEHRHPAVGTLRGCVRPRQSGQRWRRRRVRAEHRPAEPVSHCGLAISWPRIHARRNQGGARQLQAELRVPRRFSDCGSRRRGANARRARRMVPGSARMGHACAGQPEYLRESNRTVRARKPQPVPEAPRPASRVWIDGESRRRTSVLEGPSTSPYMEYEFTVRDPDLFEQICPPGIRRLRVQTVDGTPPMVAELLRSFGEASGTPVLVNTSFNGFHEPIVCSPRDAVRVFYGTGLDLLVVGNFVLRK